MGKSSNRKKERRESAVAGLSNPVARKVVAVASRGAVIGELKRASTEEQIEVLASVSPSKVGKAIMRKAPAEMDKGIKKLRREGKEVTVDALCAEIKSTPGFLSMVEQAGLSLEWFENLAKERMEAFGL